MKKSLDMRTALLLITLALIGCFLLLLVSASLNLQMRFIPISVLFGILPIFFIVTALTLFLFPGKKNKIKPMNVRIVRTLSVTTSAGFVAGVLFTKLSTLNTAYNQTRGQFVFENIGTAGIFAGFLSAVLLIDMQNYMYWPLWGKFDRSNADERQLFVRQRVFEKSYRYMIVLVIVGVLLVGFQADRMQKVAPFLVGLLAFSLPSVIAAWQKDS